MKISWSPKMVFLVISFFIAPNLSPREKMVKIPRKALFFVAWIELMNLRYSVKFLLFNYQTSILSGIFSCEN